ERDHTFKSVWVQCEGVDDSMKQMTVKQMVYLALMTALVAVATMVISIPVAATGGYVNFGDTLIFVSALIFGPLTGMLAGGLGSAMADVLGAYGVWAPFTLVVKGLEGLICGYVFLKLSEAGWSREKAVLASMVLAAGWMVIGYLISGTIIVGSLSVAAVEVPANVVQGGVSVAVAAILVRPLQKIIRK
ncbi:MAG TPA: ECF transporter S component, partial [Bacillota bacterium]|nr:ECF transporter S component [Bacillota bacterium]